MSISNASPSRRAAERVVAAAVDDGRLERAAAGIRAEDWRARPGSDCDRCRVRSVCPAQPEGREAFA